MAGVVAGLLGSLLVAPAATAAAPVPAGPSVLRLHWRPAATAWNAPPPRVPLDHDQPDGATISLA